MKRVGINVILIVIFVLLMEAMILPFISEVQLKQTKVLEDNYLWKKADKKYQMVVVMDVNYFFPLKVKGDRHL